MFREGGASMSERIEVKICGLMRREDAETAAALGADYLGVVLSSGFRRSVAPERAAELIRGLPVVAVAVVVDEDADRAAELARAMGAQVIQLHGEEPPGVAADLFRRGGWRIWKSVRARGPEDITSAARRYGAWVECILVEGFRKGVVGGGGVGLDPAAFPRLDTLLPRPLRSILAGGLRPRTVRAAVDHFAPDVVDVSSGIERETGRKDPELMRAFIEGACGVARPVPASPDRRGGGT